ncbi:MAG: sulfatase-like hydrolase/transferase [bacterium]
MASSTTYHAPNGRRQAVVIMTDSQRWDMVNAYRQTGLATPNLDRLAAGGVRFERAYDCQPLCTPARAALFTGIWPHSNGCWSNNLPLGQGVRSVGERLTAAGIHAAYIGKWHLDNTDYFGTGKAPAGWDPAVWYDMRNYLEELSPEDRVRSRREETVAEGIPADFTFAHRCSDRALDFIRRHVDQDFFLVVSYDEPHGPCLCPKAYSDRYQDYTFPGGPNLQDDLADKPEHHRVWAEVATRGRDVANLAYRHPAFFGSNEFVDHEIGRVLEVVDQACPDALVAYTSDHGHMALSHRLHIKGPAMYDEITRVPFIVRWPGHAPAGAVSPHPVSHISLTPTVLEFFGLPLPDTLEGSSILPAVRDPTRRLAEAVFMEYGRYETDHDGFGGFEPVRAVCDGRYKLVLNLLGTDELYDLTSDPHEMRNLIESTANRAARDALHDRLIAWMNETRDPFRGICWHRRPWRPDAPPATWHYSKGNRHRGIECDEKNLLSYDTGLPGPRLEAL